MCHLKHQKYEHYCISKYAIVSIITSRKFKRREKKIEHNFQFE